jgi:hypothetical protein
MEQNHKKYQDKWVLAYEQKGFLVDYLRHPEFIFNNMELAYERKSDAVILLNKVYPNLTVNNIFVAPLRDFL